MKVKKEHSVEQKKVAYPASAFAKWIEIVEEEIPKYFQDTTCTECSVCPGCGVKNKGERVFKKFGLQYQRCMVCESLYVSPRPSEDAVYNFLEYSRAPKYWYANVFTPSLPHRTVNSITPLTRWMGSIIKRYQPHAKRVLDYRPWTFSVAVRDDFPVKATPYAYKPLYVNLKGKAIEVKKLTGLYDVVISLDDIDRESNLKAYFERISKLQKKDGLLFITANTASGFEYQVLGQYSSRLVIPDRLNLLSIEAIKKLLDEYGYTILDISTPNKFDVDFVREYIAQNKNAEVSNFLRYLFTKRDETVLQSFQDFLQLSHMTSYCRIAAQKKK